MQYSDFALAPHHLDQLIEMAIAEDIGPADITTAALDGDAVRGRGEIIAREPLLLAGIDAARRVFARIDPGLCFSARMCDGAEIEAGQVIAEISGDFCSLLLGERIALNFLQRLSGIATHVRSFVKMLAGRPVKLVDTRKTVPGWRVLEKYAVRTGGAGNHRMGLYDGILIKDNHIAAFGGIREAVVRTRSRASHLVKIEIEAASHEQVDEALAAGADVIMLDNMEDADIEKAVARIDGQALVEVSGRVDRNALCRLADLGVDIISAGALIHGARFVDISMTSAPFTEQ
ncbi:MAG: carboxylating nicotinate-nucleotide diphosphorylase [Desulfosalsimonadaceae bacterium]